MGLGIAFAILMVMNTQSEESVRGFLNYSRQSLKAVVTAFSIIISLGILQFAKADAPATSPELSGLYKVTASSDPLFPARQNTDWFLDFGKGVSAGNTSGNVAISMRQNPHVQVRLLVWQLFGSHNLFIGAQTHEGSRQAVAVANWEVTRQGEALVFQRNSYQVVLKRATELD
ncbi:hypothetical protein JIN85_00530 [Luteolibacter pohnpeiensis]|uniref:Uncharacterized protein n=1 Tax=Luteolibacter pohnpeiensis TaxID=454153 RepID=A0A934S458_9BACT|nr:hypothetical protein [Luteolibacter pohnpeiensis]MBK1880875.1 hypothetical protein [Luteolibacter pohnpeiensis]